MARFIVLSIYNTLLPIFFVFAFPAWLLKMAKRGGIGSGLLERFSYFKTDALFEKQGAIYIHAVSVGETLIALKLINAWQRKHPEQAFLLVPTTATGHEVALQKAPKHVRVIYSPLDFSFILKRVFKRFEPQQIILMESEIWPNMLNVARKMKIPVKIANARLSPTSEKRYQQLGFLLRPLIRMIDTLCAQNEIDKKRWHKAGIANEKIIVTGSIKFDQAGAAKPQQRPEFATMLEAISNKPVVMTLSTHIGEEAWIAEALLPLKDDILLAIVPRHAERRAEVKAHLEKLGYTPLLRSTLTTDHRSQLTSHYAFIIDSTGELRDWTAHADITIIGKSILSKGGQNPTEAIAAGVPVITGPCMRNFEPLVTNLKQAKGITTISSQIELCEAVRALLSDSTLQQKQTEAAKTMLEEHQNATERTVERINNTILKKRPWL